jgi:hypothetical protein
MYYDRPRHQIIAEEALNELPEVFTTDDVMAWLRPRYPSFKKSGIYKVLLGMSVNYRGKTQYRTSSSQWRDRLLKIGPNQFRKRP